MEWYTNLGRRSRLRFTRVNVADGRKWARNVMKADRQSEERRQALIEILGDVVPKIQTVLNVTTQTTDRTELVDQMRSLHERLERYRPLFLGDRQVTKALTCLGNLGGSAVSPYFSMTAHVFELFEKEMATLEAALARENTISAEFSEEKRIDKALTPAQQQDYKKYDYLSRATVHIPGGRPMKRSNEVVVNRHRTKVGDRAFRLLVRLVVELKKGDGGWVNTLQLEEDRVIPDPRLHHVYSDLRKAVEGSLHGRDGMKFIENDGSQNFRISTHPDLITYDKEKLTNHPDNDVAAIASKLP